MKEAIILSSIGLMMVLSSVTVHPHPLHSESSGEADMSGDSGEKAVGGQQTDSNYLQLAPGKKPKAGKDLESAVLKTGPCVDGGTADSLQREQLEKILDTVYPITGNPTPYATLLTPDHGINMYFTEFDPLTAYQVMLGGIGDASNIWTNYSPCPTCVRALLDKYNKPEDEKPTIHVAGIYTESNSVTHIVESLECLGKLVHGGFSIVPWNFKAPEGVPAFLDTCNSDIDVYYGNSYFTSAYTKLERLVTFIQQLGANPHANLWCTA